MHNEKQFEMDRNRDDNKPKTPATINHIGILLLMGHWSMYIEPTTIMAIGIAAEMANIIVTITYLNFNNLFKFRRRETINTEKINNTV